MTMRAVQVTELTGADGVTVGDVPEPQLDGSGVVIDVHAAGVVFGDTLMARGLYQVKPELPFIPGVEVAGVVAEASGDAHVRPGDRVSALLSHGGMAERVVASAGLTFPLANELSFVQGAALTANTHTAYFALVHRTTVSPGERVLVFGAAGGLGVALLQVSKALGARTIGVVSSQAKAEVARRAGADDTIVGYDELETAVRAVAPDGVDVVADPVGGDAIARASVRLLAVDGRFIVLGFAGGEIPKLGANRIMFANIAVVGAAYGAYVETRTDTAQAVARGVNQLVAAGHAHPIVELTLPLEGAGDALRRIESREVQGKVVLELR
jgi:NADPH2:quinone reductase